jgi:hypothetical protein
MVTVCCKHLDWVHTATSTTLEVMVRTAGNLFLLFSEDIKFIILSSSQELRFYHANSDFSNMGKMT